MSRVEDLKALHAAELEMVEAEEELLAAKDAGELTGDIKIRLRNARQVYRELTAGEGTANPGPLEAKAEVQ